MNTNQKKYDTILWDLDGTLLYTLDDLANSVNAALVAFNLPTHSNEKIKTFVGNGVEKLMARAVAGGKDNPDFQAIFAFFKEHYQKNCNNSTRPYDGILPLLDKLKAEGWKQGIVSNKIDPAVKELTAIYFSEQMQAAVGDNPQHRKKPAPDNVEYALEQLNSTKERTIFIGDSEVDIMTAQNAGTAMIIVDWGYKDRNYLQEKGGENVVSSTAELYQVLQRLNG